MSSGRFSPVFFPAICECVIGDIRPDRGPLSAEPKKKERKKVKVIVP